MVEYICRKNIERERVMNLTIIENRNLYCTFEEEDINKYFSLTFEEFSNNRKLVEKFANVIIKKAVKSGQTDSFDESDFEISLYELGYNKYSIHIKQMKEKGDS